MLAANTRSSESFQSAMAHMVPRSAKTMTGHSLPQFMSLYSTDRKDLHNFDVRLKTYLFSPRWAKIRSKELAECGFYYTGNEDELKCFDCSLILNHLQPTDDPRCIHKHRSNNCRFITNIFDEESDESSDEEEDELDGEVAPVRSNEMKPGPELSKPSAVNELKKPTVKVNLDKASLKSENERLRHAMTCCKCETEKVQTLFLPCRHLVTCEVCAETMDLCIKCNVKILGTVRTFMV